MVMLARWARRGVAPAALALVSVSCATDYSLMVPIRPVDGWRVELEEQRKSRDESFRTSQNTPLAPHAIDGFEGLDYWLPDPDYHFAGDVHFYVEPQRFTIIATSGQSRPCEKIGWLGFELHGRVLHLQVYRLLDQDPSSLFLPFMDATTGEETYAAGRYVDLIGPPGGPYVFDLNTAYNPSCAYGAPDRFACPRTPPENRLPVRIEAGERGFIAPPGSGDAPEQPGAPG